MDWLIATCVYWVVAAIFFGGIYDAESGSSRMQGLGLVLNFAAFLAVFAVLRLALGSLGGESAFLGTVLGLVIPLAIPTMLTGRLGKIVFGMVGVRMARKVFSADAH